METARERANLPEATLSAQPTPVNIMRADVQKQKDGTFDPLGLTPNQKKQADMILHDVIFEPGPLSFDKLVKHARAQLIGNHNLESQEDILRACASVLVADIFWGTPTQGSSGADRKRYSDRSMKEIRNIVDDVTNLLKEETRQSAKG
jgi:hypothetical protein